MYQRARNGSHGLPSKLAVQQGGFQSRPFRPRRGPEAYKRSVRENVDFIKVCRAGKENTEDGRLLAALASTQAAIVSFGK
jgi:hypothetical protein